MLPLAGLVSASAGSGLPENPSVFAGPGLRLSTAPAGPDSSVPAPGLWLLALLWIRLPKPVLSLPRRVPGVPATLVLGAVVVVGLLVHQVLVVVLGLLVQLLPEILELLSGLVSVRCRLVLACEKVRFVSPVPSLPAPARREGSLFSSAAGPASTVSS